MHTRISKTIFSMLTCLKVCPKMCAIDSFHIIKRIHALRAYTAYIACLGLPAVRWAFLTVQEYFPAMQQMQTAL